MTGKHSPLNTFSGTRFVLIGFDPVTEQKVRSRLVDAGGVDAGRYNQNCTHVIVDKIVYDDPVCLTARNDGKIVVSRLWVCRSFDTGMPVDAASIMYRPPRDLNGIPGAKSLIICLTGYQKQDREDIMTMVGLMGAQFSKPLVASKVTHLICYKFEGEKYLLAKRTEKIKLVNRHWLEDCLRDWELLPEANYDRSDYELEIMEVEAKDSEEEAEDTGMKQFRGRNFCKSPAIFNVEIQDTVKAPRVELNAPVQRPEFSTGNDPSKAAIDKDMVLTSNKVCQSHQASAFDDISLLVRRGCKETSVSDAASSDLSPGPMSSKAGNDLVSRSSLSGLKFYSRKTTRKSSVTTAYEASGNLNGSPRSGLGNLEAANVFDLSSADHAMHRTCTHIETPDKITESHNGLSPSTLFQKRTDTLSAISGKSEKIGHHSTTSIMRSQLVKCSEQGLGPYLHERNNNFRLRDNQQPTDERVTCDSCSSLSTVISPCLSSKLTTDDVQPPKSKTTEIEDKQAPQTPLCNGKSTNVTSTIKSLGSIANLNKTSKWKGAFYSRKIASKVNSARCLSKGKVAEVVETANDTEMSFPTVGVESAKDKTPNLDVGVVSVQKTVTMDDKTEVSSEKDKHEFEKQLNSNDAEEVEGAHEAPTRLGLEQVIIDCNTSMRGVAKCLEVEKNTTELEAVVSSKKVNLVRGKKRSLGIGKVRTDPNVKEVTKSKKREGREENQDRKEDIKAKERKKSKRISNPSSKVSRNGSDWNLGSPKEIEGNKSDFGEEQGSSLAKLLSSGTTKVNDKSEKVKLNSMLDKELWNNAKQEPVWFILSGHKSQRQEFRQAIRRLKGRCCRDSHQWSYQATHFITPELHRTEKLFAAAASGRWILRSDYLSACSKAGTFVPEEPYEWHEKGLSEDCTINLEAPRKWRLLRKKTGHGALYGVRIIVYGDHITPPLDTLKRVVKAGDGTVVATSPPYTRFLTSGIDFAIISPGIRHSDTWVQEFLKHEIPCVTADYLVEYVCKAGYSLERHVLYNTRAWAQRSFSNLQRKAEEITEASTQPCDSATDGCRDSSRPPKRTKRGK